MLVFFFFSSRRRHTRCSRDWSSDVCSSDLLAADPKIEKKSGRVFSSWGLSEEYDFCDADGRKPHWGNHAKKKYGDVMKPCDENFYEYWTGGLMDSIFPNWP